MRRFCAFTLIEMLVVISIMALLISIAMPSLAAARRLSKKTVCQKQLEQIGVGMHAYLMVHNDTFPYIARLPSYEQKAADTADPPRKPYLPMDKVLKQELSNTKDVFKCPADENTRADTVADHPITTRHYYENEGTSYEWESQLNGLRINFKGVRILSDSLLLKPADTWMMFDFEAFHNLNGNQGAVGTLNSLYADLHVASDKNKSNRVIGQSSASPVPPSVP